MKKRSISIIAAAMLVAPTAGYCFEGLSAGVNANFANASTEISGTILNTATSIGVGGQNSQFASLQGAYGFAVGKDFILTIGGNYGLGDVKSGKLTVGTSSASIKAENIWNVYVEPGMKFGSSALVYGKIGYTGFKGKAELTGATLSDRDFKGWSLGAGVRVMLNKAMYGQVEFVQSKYYGETISGATYKPNTTVGTVGIGMHF